MKPVTFFGAATRSFAVLFGGRQQERFKTEAQVVDGMVLTKSISRDKNISTFWVGYRFPAPDGTLLRSEVKVSGPLWDRLVEREPVTRRPEEPDASRPGLQGVRTVHDPS